MRIESVTAHAFGPLTDRTLELAPGLTVVAGANESAKSSWHAAIYAALCGRRRGRGAATTAERRFAELHKPWHDKDWKVSAIIALDDGRRVELHQDLAGRTGCRATDLGLGRDISAEVMFEGAPDASRWLGLDRKSFAATACVNQAELLGVLGAANGLRDHLRRAAATSGADATAAAALEGLEVFHRDHVGRERPDSATPLQVAEDRLTRARQDLAEAQGAHQRYLELVEEAEIRRAEADAAAELADRADTAATALDELLAATRAHTAAERKALRSKEKADDRAAEVAKAERRLARTRELDARFGGTAPAGLAAQEEVTRIVHAALAAWRAVPSARRLTGSSAAELREELAFVPDPPTGDTEVEPRIHELALARERALAVVSAHEGRRPVIVDRAGDARLTAALAAGPAVVRELAASLAAPPPPVRTGLRTAVSALAGLVGVAGVALLVAGRLPGLALLAPALFVGVLRIVESATSDGRGAGQHIRRTSPAVVEATSRCAALGLPAEPLVLQELATRAERQIGLRASRAVWDQHHRQYAEAVTRKAGELRSALADKGWADPRAEVSELLAGYERSCALGARQAVMAAQRDVLTRAIVERDRAEEAAVEVEGVRAKALELVRGAVRAVDGNATATPTGTAAELLASLNAWQRGWEHQLRAAAAERDAWTELTTLLADSTPDELAAGLVVTRAEHAELLAEAGRDAEEAATALARRDELAAACGTPADAEEVEALLAEARTAVATARAEARQVACAADELGGALAERGRTLPDVPEAEEALATAQDDVAALTSLSTTLTLTGKYLAAAQDAVHRDIAPSLAATLRGRLPGVTDGRYTDARVDPATLEVSVRGPAGPWRPAANLSLGTAEQVYLLLRFALAEHLSTTGETCPLLLDDITVQADDGRTTAILDLLLKLATERQVVLFAQETAVLDWAREHLDGGHDALRELTRIPAE
ncbi:AAA family ATPase [Umezawaea sp. Da 62-37]|uniref:AAA family ATPase n=1 Tax=Umezawaea sp. Da 62-37 TaxID=3075927 RepID=UPI0028F6ED42|nr:AAA family ATPase [Umezawaea sp. Da 62-37]WNV83755.1 AAA family ATPase [Umezawaea sp. Da 62-37]